MVMIWLKTAPGTYSSDNYTIQKAHWGRSWWVRTAGSKDRGPWTTLKKCQEDCEVIKILDEYPPTIVPGSLRSFVNVPPHQAEMLAAIEAGTYPPAG